MVPFTKSFSPAFTKTGWAATALAASVLGAGCGGDKDSDSVSSGAAAEPTPTMTRKVPPATDTSSVVMKSIAFKPAAITVRLGKKVTWTNKDSTTHNVVADSGAKFASKPLGKGRTYHFKPKKTGTIKYECTLHPGMQGTITVTK